MHLDLPKSYPLTGTDYFLLVLDKQKRKVSPLSCICRLAVDVQGDLSVQEIRMQLQEFALIPWLNSLRLKAKLPLQLPRWQASNKHTDVPIYEWFAAEGEDLPQQILNRDLRLDGGFTLVFDLIRRKSQRSTLVLSWHHALMDARGGEMLLKLVFGGLRADAKGFFGSAAPVAKYVAKLNQSKRAKEIVMSNTAEPVGSLVSDKTFLEPTLRYKLFDFSAATTAQIDASCEKAGARFKKSVYYMAATALSLNNVLKKRGLPEKALCVPVPQDLRRRGAFGPLLSNQVSFIFFRIEPEAMRSLQDCIKAINVQMMNQVKEERQKSFAMMLDVFRRIPLAIYSRMLSSSLNANSFFFSDTGESLSDLKSILERPVLSVRHYSPNSYPPGFTIIFTRFAGALHATLAYAEESLSQDELNAFSKDLEGYLLTGAAVADQ